MGIQALVPYRISCDFCDANLTVTEEDEYDAQTAARTVGWRFRSNGAYDRDGGFHTFTEVLCPAEHGNFAGEGWS